MDENQLVTRVEIGSERPLPGPIEVEASRAAIGRFLVLGCLGSGAMGVVYVAFDPQLERKVAVKLVRSDPGGASLSSGGHARLLREAQAMAKLSHPNVVAVHEVGEWGGDVYLAMEYVRGLTLRTWLEEQKQRDPQRRRWREVLAVVLQAGEGLAAAHAAGVVHRDFKPDNVLVGDDGRVRVVDFGLARGEVRRGAPVLATDDVELTRAGSIVGTPAYMAPEQHRGAICDARGDQFSFGVALWEALYGERPFPGKDIAELAQRKLAGPRAVPKGSRVPRWLVPVLARALQADPALRYPDMRALIEGLRRDPWRERRRALVVVTAVVVAVAGVVAYRRIEAETAARLIAERVEMCAGAEALLVGAWDGERREALGRRFEGEGLAAIGEAVQQKLDRYATEWAGAREQVCLATRLHARQPESVKERRDACLDRALAAVRSRVDAILAAEAGALARTGELLQLQSLETCTEGQQNGHMDVPADAAAVAALEDRADRLATQLDFELAGTAEQIEALALAAAEQEYRPLQAKAALLRGRQAETMARYAAAHDEYLEALRLAEVGRDDRTAIEALVHLLHVVTLHTRSQAEAEALVSRLHAAYERLGEDDPGLSARVLRAEAKVAAELGRHEKAALLFSRCAREHARAGQLHHAASALGNIGVIYNRMHRPRAAIPFFETTLSQAARLGDASPMTRVNQYINMGRSYLLLEEHAIARGLFAQAEALVTEMLRGDPGRLASHPSIALARFNRGMARLADDPRAAKDLLLEALAFRRRVYGESSMYTAAARAELARAHLELGEVEAAAELVAGARATFVATEADGDVEQLRQLEFLEAAIAGRRGRVEVRRRGSSGCGRRWRRRGATVSRSSPPRSSSRRRRGRRGGAGGRPRWSARRSPATSSAPAPARRGRRLA